MKIIYFDRNHENYEASSYQADFFNTLKKYYDVIPYGPGYSNFDKNDNLEKLIKNRKISKNDIFFVGHDWLTEKPKKKNSYPDFDFEKIENIKIIFLNKEYFNLEAKLNYIKKNKFSFALTHNQNIDEYQKYSGIKFYFLPFAINHSLENLQNHNKEIDVFFSGLYQNKNVKNIQNDIRIKLMKKFYYSIGVFKILKKTLYKNKKIFFNGITTNNFQNKILKKIGMYKYLKKDDYYNYLSKSRITLSTLSPSDLIGNRMFEAMALKSLVLCENSSKYHILFKPYQHYIPYDLNLKDFDEKMSFGLSDSKEVKQIIENAYDNVFKLHTWDKRVNYFIKILDKYVSEKNFKSF